MIDFIRKGKSTSDATATANDIINPKTAYVNNEKITGSIQTEMLQTSLSLANETLALQATNNYVLDYDTENNIVASATTNNNITAFDVKTETTNKTIQVSEAFGGYSYLKALTFVKEINSNEIQALCLIADSNNNCRIGLLCLDDSLNVTENTIVSTSVNLKYTTSCSIIYNFAKDVYTIITDYGRYDRILKVTLCKILNGNISIILKYDILYENENIENIYCRYVHGSWSPNGEHLSLMLEFPMGPYNQRRYGFTISNFNSGLTSVSNFLVGNEYRNSSISKYKRTFLNDDYIICGNIVYKFNTNSLEQYKTINLSEITSRNIYDYDIVLNGRFYLYFAINTTSIYVYSFDDAMNFTYIKTIPFTVIAADMYYNRTLAEAKFYKENGVKYSEDNVVKILYTTSESPDFASLERNTVKYYNTTDATNTSSSNLLEGKIAYGQNGKIVGTMPNNGALNYNATTSQQIIPAGYTSGGTIEASPVTQTDYDAMLGNCIDVVGDTIVTNNLAYIESSGSQHINTNIVPNNNTLIELSIKKSGNVIDWERICGIKDVFEIMRDDTANFMLKINNTELSSSISISNTKFSKLRFGKGNVYLDDELLYNYSQTFSTSSMFYLFFANGADRHGSFQLEYCKIYQNDDLVRDFVPMLDSNNEICLYDKVSETYFYNQGSGSFTSGQRLVSEDLNDYINKIETEKEEKITPDNIKKDVQIFDITGTYEGSGVTPDTTISNGDYGLETATSGEGDNDIGYKFFTNANTQSKLYETGSIVEVHITNELLAQVLGITADKLKSGEVICGIEGTYSGEANNVVEEE